MVTISAIKSTASTSAIIFTIIPGISDTKENTIGCRVLKSTKHIPTTIIAFIQLSFKLLP